MQIKRGPATSAQLSGSVAETLFAVAGELLQRCRGRGHTQHKFTEVYLQVASLQFLTRLAFQLRSRLRWDEKLLSPYLIGLKRKN